MKKSKSKSKKNVRPGFLVFMAALVLGTMGIVLYLIRGGGGGRGGGGTSNVKCGGATSGYCDWGYDCTPGQSGYKCVPQSCTNNQNLCQNGSTCKNGKCQCGDNFTGEFCDQVIPTGDCNTGTCKLPHCIINNTYTQIKGFTPDKSLLLQVACVDLKKSDGTACDDSKDCVDQAKQRCDRTPGCKSFYYYGSKGTATQHGRWCPKVEFDPDKDKGKGQTDTQKYGDFYYIDKTPETANTCVCAVGFQNHPDDIDTKLCTQCIDKRGPSRRLGPNTPATDCSMKLFGYKDDDLSNMEFGLECQESLDSTLRSECTDVYGTHAEYAGADDYCFVNNQGSDPCGWTKWVYKCKVPAYWSDPAHNPRTFDTCSHLTKKKKGGNDGNDNDFPKWSSGPKTGQKAFLKYTGTKIPVPDNYATGDN